jgi:hypothetical protein
MEIIDKIVEFDKYCKKCEYYKSDDAVDPCHNCLNNPTNVNSRKPVEFKEKTEKKK